MSDPLRTDLARALDGAPDTDREAKIEQLLLVGLDHYFAAQYEQAINVWSRALFLDRSHARARAYIERARSALAERLRQSEELLHDGVAAFHRGESDEARRLLEAAMHQGAPSDEALAVLDRLDRLEQSAVVPPAPAAPPGAPRAFPGVAGSGPGARIGPVAWSAAAAIAVVAAGILAMPDVGSWASVLPRQSLAPTVLSAPAASDRTPPIPRRGETALARARALAASGHLHDALKALDLVRATDTQRPEADRLRGEIQQQLLALGGPLP
jgi:tetratricopeptide (TPR) repeat protein